MRRFSWILALMIIVGLAPSVMASNMALELKGDAESFFEVPDHDSLDANLADHFTVEAWVKPYDVNGEHIILNKEDAYEIAVIDGKFMVAVQPQGGSWAWIDSGVEIPVNEWTHVALTYDGTNVSLFVNGKLATQSDQWPGVVNNSLDTLKVGRRTRGTPGVHSIYIGLVDEVRISKIVRYTNDFAVPTTGFLPDADTVALYHFDAAAGDLVQDASPAANHGNLRKNAPLIPADTPLKM